MWTVRMVLTWVLTLLALVMAWVAAVANSFSGGGAGPQGIPVTAAMFFLFSGVIGLAIAMAVYNAWSVRRSMSSQTVTPAGMIGLASCVMSMCLCGMSLLVGLSTISRIEWTNLGFSTKGIGDPPAELEALKAQVEAAHAWLSSDPLRPRNQIAFLDEATDEDVQRLPMIPIPFYVSLPPRVTDEGISYLAKQSMLESIEVRSGNVSGVGFKDLAKLEHLIQLDLSGSNLTDGGLIELAGLKNVQRLALYNANVTPQRLQELSRLKQLASLTVSGGQLTPGSLAEIPRFTSLRSLTLLAIQVTDDDLKSIADHKSLTALYVEGDALTDEGLKSLQAIKTMRRLDIGQAGVTAAGVSALHAALPECTIFSPVGSFEGK